MEDGELKIFDCEGSEINNENIEIEINRLRLLMV